MEASGPSSLTQGSPNPRQDGTALTTNDDDFESYVAIHDSRPYNNSSTLPKSEYNEQTSTITTSADCDRRRPEEGGHPRMANMSSSLISQTVTPFLREHIPNNYAPISKVDNDDTSMSKDPNSKFCYRHRPDSKCRKAADESKMGMIQRVCIDMPDLLRPVITMLTFLLLGT
jgi:F-box/WD-40 domain protein MET30